MFFVWSEVFIGDGCNSECRIEEGWICYKEVCTQCGDGVIKNSETCDDGNQNSGDGCNHICQVESGYTCKGEPSVCFVCGNGIREEGE